MLSVFRQNSKRKEKPDISVVCRCCECSCVDTKTTDCRHSSGWGSATNNSLMTRRKASGSSSRSLRQDRDRDRDIDIDKNRDIDRQRQKFSFKHGRSDCTETSPLDRA